MHIEQTKIIIIPDKHIEDHRAHVLHIYQKLHKK